MTEQTPEQTDGEAPRTLNITEPMDPTWVPSRYPKWDPSNDGVWRQVLEAGEPVGVIWTDGGDSAGVRWYTQTQAITDLDMHFRTMRSMDAPAAIAYQLAQDVPNVDLGPEQTGPLSGVDQALEEIEQTV
jgi:hypothetical protein